ncbi:hypothetical protein [Streptomyces sp. AK02-01A]|uniref:hypothetical protein n=1 Tax=Streptomyces sp. AK02-01A TaxID=3028648 RepID=UPI0029BCC969|nr:hypothetical protein [Streptomyces sp. AK02-01A]MDX3852150.1 hypothetical protein [Streptomyces sp. AK02-01A]
MDADGRYGWRIVAQNGRVVAVSAVTFGSYEQCRKAFGDLCRRYAVLSGGVQHAVEGNGWMWAVRDEDGRRMIVSARSYERYSTCRASYVRFCALLRGFGDSGEVPWSGG